MEAPALPPPRYPPRRLAAAPPPRLASAAQSRQRRGVTLLFAVLVGALGALFFLSFMEDVAGDTSGTAEDTFFADTQF